MGGGSSSATGGPSDAPSSFEASVPSLALTASPLSTADAQSNQYSVPLTHFNTVTTIPAPPRHQTDLVHKGKKMKSSSSSIPPRSASLIAHTKPTPIPPSNTNNTPDANTALTAAGKKTLLTIKLDAKAQKKVNGYATPNSTGSPKDMTTTPHVTCNSPNGFFIAGIQLLYICQGPTISLSSPSL
jgi:hypothetical protein